MDIRDTYEVSMVEVVYTVLSSAPRDPFFDLSP